MYTPFMSQTTNPICNAPCLSNTSDQVEFREDDIYFSNQGEAGTCVRHAIAKAMQREITGFTKDKLKFNTSALVGFLVTKLDGNKAKGCWPTDFDGVSGSVLGKRGIIYDVKLRIRKVENGAGHVQVLELAKIYPDYEPGHDLHAVFAQYGNSNTHTLRNSWGTHKEWINIPKNKTSTLIHSSYYVWIMHLEKQNMTGPSQLICEKGRWNDSVIAKLS